MSTGAAVGCCDKEAGAYRYQRHQPENTLLYQIVERYYPEFTAYLAELNSDPWDRKGVGETG